MKNKFLIFGMVFAMLASGAQALAEENDIMLINEESEIQFVKSESPITEERLTVDEKGIKAEDFKYFYNNLGEKIKAEDIKKGDEVITYKEGEKGIAAILMMKDTYSAPDVDYYKISDSFGDVVNLKNDLALHLNEEIPTENADGEKLAAATAKDLDGSLVLAFCTATAMSIPAQATPEKIIILEKAEQKDETKELKEIKVSADKVVKKDDVVMLPMREVAEGMGYEVGWNGEKRSITVGTVQMGVNFAIGENKYFKSKMTPFVLDKAPELINELTYVPAGFFTDVLWAEVTENTDGSVSVKFE